MLRLTPAERKLRAQIAANTRWAHTDAVCASAAARQRDDGRFAQEVDPDGILDPVERAKRARRAKRAYYQRLALASARARRERAGGGRDVAC